MKCQGSRSVTMIDYTPDLVSGKGPSIEKKNHESGTKRYSFSKALD